MKLAYIDHKLYDKATFSKDIISYAKKEGIELKIAQSIDEFRLKHGPINACDGMIIHPGIQNAESLREFREYNKSLKIVAVAAGVLEYHDLIDDVKIFDYLYKEKLFDYFKN